MTAAAIAALVIGFVIFVPLGAMIEYLTTGQTSERKKHRTILHDVAETAAWLSIGFIVVSVAWWMLPK